MPSEHVIDARNTKDAASSSAPQLVIGPATVSSQCERLLRDPLFSNSRRTSELLKYIVERSLHGNHDELKERIIGIEVFGRASDYNTSNDAAVRVAITELRKRLARYYEYPAHSDEIRIELPPGSYVARFNLPSEPAKAMELQAGSSAAAVSSDSMEQRGISQKDHPVALRSRQRQTASIWAAVSLVVTVAVLVGTTWFSRRTASQSPIDRFWAPVLSNSSNVLITIGVPSGEKPGGDAQGGPLVAPTPDTTLGRFITSQPDFPIAELNAANSINAFLSHHGKASSIRVARSTTLSDMRGIPVIALGSYSNNWAMRHDTDLRFQFQQDDTGRLHWISDAQNPGDRSWFVNLDAPYGQVGNEYALITRDVDGATGTWWIGLGGTTVLGTLAAQQMVMDRNAMSILESQLPRTWEQGRLQVVVAFKVVDGSVGSAHVVATNLR